VQVFFLLDCPASAEIVAEYKKEDGKFLAPGQGFVNYITAQNGGKHDKGHQKIAETAHSAVKIMQGPYEMFFHLFFLLVFDLINLNNKLPTSLVNIKITHLSRKKRCLFKNSVGWLTQNARKN
jgi:hypothetical protein